MTAKRGSGSTKTGRRKAQEAPSVGPESSAPALNGDPNGKPPEALSGGQESSAPALNGDRGRLTKMLQSIKRAPVWAWAIAAVVLVAVSLPILAIAGVLGGDSAAGDGGNAGKTANPPEVQKPVEGSFVGKVSGMKVLVAVVAAPAEARQNERAVEVYVTDGNRVSESFSGPITDNEFVAKSTGGDAEAEGKLSGESVTGTVEVGNRKAARYNASQPAGAAGLYNLTVSPRGKMRGSSSAGLGVAGRIELVTRTGVLRLADGRRVKLDIAEDPASDLRLRAGQVRLIVLPSGEVAGAGKSPLASEGGSSVFFIRSRS